VVRQLKPKSTSSIQTNSGKTVTYVHADVGDKEALDGVFKNNAIEGVIHFSALKPVGAHEIGCKITKVRMSLIWGLVKAILTNCFTVQPCKSGFSYKSSV